MHSLHDGRITLMKGDCLDLMRDIPDQSVDAIITDPPYGTTACKWDSVIPFEPMWQHLKRIIKPRGAIVLFGSQPFTSALVMSNPKWFKYSLVWQKSHITGNLNAKIQPMREHEDVSIFGLGRITYNPQLEKKPHHLIRPATTRAVTSDCYGLTRDHQRTNPVDVSVPKSIIRINSANHGEMGLHPTQKPTKLLEYLIKTYTNPDETVLDFTFGSCTTGVAALNTGRKFIGIERDDHYYSVGLQRVEYAIAALPPMAV